MRCKKSSERDNMDWESAWLDVRHWMLVWLNLTSNVFFQVYSVNKKPIVKLASQSKMNFSQLVASAIAL